MQAQVVEPQTVKTQSQQDVKFAETGIWNVLHSAAMTQMAELIGAVRELAPEPGALVVLDVKRLPYNWDGWNPVLFSAIDICTQLQIARMYLTPTHASAYDFLQFLVDQYPFPTKEIRTAADPLFVNPSSIQSEHQFTVEAKKRGIFHSVVLDPTEHPVLRVMSKYYYGGTFDGNHNETSRQKVITGLVNFLFFHNNHRSLASIGGLTPLQKLNSFAGYENIPWFDPYRPAGILKTGNGSH
ncbi:MAG TPA: hypothetical protein VII11_01720 [Bacteroidota bacterium]